MKNFAFWLTPLLALFLMACPGEERHTVVEDTGGTVPEETTANTTPTTDPYAPTGTGQRPWTPPAASTSTEQRFPVAKKEPGKSGFVRSPYAQYAGLVDVSGIAPGTQVRCPYTNNIFIVP